MTISSRSLTLILCAGLAAAPLTSRACSDCGCSLSSDWDALGFSARPGCQLDLRYEYYEQTDLRAGTGRVDRSTLTFPEAREIQQSTLNRNLWLGLNYAGSSTWGVSVEVPYTNRFHDTIAEGDTAVSTSRATGFGDLRVLAHWQTPGTAENFSLQLGLKLPTGRFTQEFADGPQAGETLDRGLQLGTGTTDLLAGAGWFARPTASLGCFAQVLLERPLAARADFQPSTSLSLNGGLRWHNASRVTPQLQLNVRWDGREHGAEADTENSGATLAYVSPGFTAALGANTTASAFVQLPVYQRVSGLQLEPRWLLSLGLRHNF